MVNIPVNFKPSVYTFTDPVRRILENDPFFYKVFNRSIDELQNNDNWLRDQISNLSVEVETIDRSGFSELKPVTNNSDNVLTVKKGRFSARVNDAYNKDPLVRLSLITGTALGELERWQATSRVNIFQLAARIISTTVADGLNFNGLEQKIATFTNLTEDSAYARTTPSYQGNGSTNADIQAFPVVQDYISTLGMAVNDVLNNSTASYFANILTRRWRGIARTAIVDVPDDLSIEIPAFDPNDFFITSGQAVQLADAATQRIDLVFVYTHPIDASSTTIQKYSGGSPTTINSPQLGIVRGAGVGLVEPVVSSLRTVANPLANQDADGNNQILASVADSQGGALNGFSGLDIHGSFPSPDDLMNLAPLLVNSLQDTDPQLIGQSILPICYVVVDKNATVNSEGNIVLNSDNVIDIRPFFRTAELTYNERAGIAAAVPQLSLANPAVGQLQLDTQVNQIVSLVNTLKQPDIPTQPQYLAGGSVRGGLLYGVEGSILRQFSTAPSAYTAPIAMDSIITDFVNDASIPLNPEWDLAEWTVQVPADAGSYRNDWLNIKNITSVALPGEGTTILGATNYGNEQVYQLCFVKKRIDLTNIPLWADPAAGGTYTVNVKLENSTLKSKTGSNRNDSSVTEFQSIWVERRKDHFIIYVMWPVNAVGTFFQYTNASFRDSTSWSAVAALVEDALFLDNNGVPNITVATYPSVSYEVIGHPPGRFYAGNSTINLGG